MKKAIQWLLNQKSIDPANPVKYLTNQHKHLDQEKLTQPMPHPTAPEASQVLFLGFFDFLRGLFYA